MAKQLKEIEIPFGAKDSELKGWEYTIPEGMEAEIKDGKIIVREKESEDEKIKKDIVTYLTQSADSATLKVNAQKFNKWIAWLEKQDEQKSILPKWKYKSDNVPLLKDSIILNKYGCVAKSPSGALVSDVWVIDYAELAKLPKEVEKQGE